MDKILILKIGAIGDVVMTSCILPFIKEHNDCQITWIIGKTAAPIISATQMVDELIVLDDEKLLKGNFFQRLSEIFKLWRKIAFKKFDLALSCHVDIRYRFLVWPVIKKKFRFFSRNKRYIPGRYHASEYIRLLTGEEGSFTYSVKYPRLVDSFPEHLLPLFSKDKKRVALLPGGAKNLLANNSQRRWPIENYVKLAEKFLHEGHQVLLLGSASDQWTLPFFEKLNVLDVIGKTELLELVSLLKRMDLFITHDSGPMHLAKLAGCRTIALFGPTQPSEFLGNSTHIHPLWGGKALSCRPCYDGKRFASCSRNLCMENISLQEVVKLAETLLEKRSVPLGKVTQLKSFQNNF